MFIKCLDVFLELKTTRAIECDSFECMGPLSTCLLKICLSSALYSFVVSKQICCFRLDFPLEISMASFLSTSGETRAAVYCQITSEEL